MANKTAPVKKRRATDRPAELVIITGLSGSGKGSVLKALEDLGYYSVDNLPVDLIPKFAELTQDSATVRAAALVVDVREGEGLKRFPDIYTRIRNHVKTRLVFLEADDNAILRRFSETRRPHPLGTENSIAKSIKSERRQLAPIRAMADLIINTSKFTVHELRDFIARAFAAIATSPRSWSMSPASATATACPPIATWSSTCASCRTRTTFRASRN
jgi:UPF0042 nucleotide-binding protein